MSILWHDSDFKETWPTRPAPLVNITTKRFHRSMSEAFPDTRARSGDWDQRYHYSVWARLVRIVRVYRSYRLLGLSSRRRALWEAWEQGVLGRPPF